MPKQSYVCPEFSDVNRLSNIKKVIPSIDRLYKEYADKNHIPGYSYAIVLDGEMVHNQYAGFADVSTKNPVTSNTVFRIASLSKSFTAMAILRLCDSGKLFLDDPVNQYIPELSNQNLSSDAPLITIRHLLTHMSGLPQDDPWGDRKLSDTPQQLTKLIGAGLHFSNSTGVAFEYSNLGYTVLGDIISKVSGLSYQEYIAKYIWQPLNMPTASWEYTSTPKKDLALGYKWENNAWIEEPILHDGAFGCMGGVLVSVADFCKYIALHQSAWPARNGADDGPVSRSTLRSMHQPLSFDLLNNSYKLMDGSNLGFAKGYGYGLFWLRDEYNKTYVFHPGSLPGYHAHWCMLPEYGIAVVVMGNIKNAPRFDVNMQALNTLVKDAGLEPRTLAPSLILKQRQAELIKLLPSWSRAAESGIFAPNFLLDNSLESWHKHTVNLFDSAGDVKGYSDLAPENQLRGYFMVNGSKSILKIRFTLAPEDPALIQELSIEAG